MKNQFNLNIKTPCQENFNQFTATSKGGFCDSCEKEVIDFTTMNTEGIINYFKTQNKQLKTYNQIPLQRKSLNILSGISLAIISLFSFNSVQAQDIKKQTKSNRNVTEINASKFQNSFNVKGNVSNDSETLPGVNIILQGSSTGTQTDFNGNFEFPKKLKKGDVLIFSYVGLESQKVVIEDTNSASKIELNVDMKLDDIILIGKVAVKDIYKSKRD